MADSFSSTTHKECIFAFPKQQWLPKHSSTLAYTFVSPTRKRKANQYNAFLLKAAVFGKSINELFSG
jgi:hypothetical protein